MSVNKLTVHKNLYIQNLRGYAATLVVVDHALLRQANFGTLSKGIEFVANDLGAMGVHIFFVISGFIMMFNTFESFNRAGAPGRFMLARIKRIVPLYYAATIVAIAISNRGNSAAYRWSDIALSMAFMPSHVHMHSVAAEYLYPVLGVGWTLNYEMFFYLLFAIALLFTRRSGTLFLTCTLLLLIAMGSGLRQFSQYSIGASITFDIFYYFTRDIMLYFLFGIIIAILARKGWMPSRTIPTPALWGCIFGIFGIFLYDYLLPGEHPVWRSAFAMIVAIVSVALCVVAIPGKPDGLSVKLGDASYSIYLFHGFLMSAIASLWQRWVGEAYLAEGAASVLLGLGGGYLIYAFIENPLNLFLHRKHVSRPDKTETQLAFVEPT
jgi:exopolysaccharide production protein ExoZ